MNKAKEILTTQNIVKEILETNKAARNSDMALYIKVCERINPLILSKPFWVVLLSLKEYNLPSIETVGRARRKLQEMFPELAGDADVSAQRMLNEEAFKEYARGMA
jgi:hypothetical protein